MRVIDKVFEERKTGTLKIKTLKNQVPPRYHCYHLATNQNCEIEIESWTRNDEVFNKMASIIFQISSGPRISENSKI